MSAIDQETLAEVVSDVGPWAMVPEWLLRTAISDRAIRLFGQLALYADHSSREAFPSRARLAADLHTSQDSIDRALRELVDAKALVVTARRDDAGDRTTNLYRLSFVRDQRPWVAAPVRPPLRMGAATGSRTGAARVAAPVRHRTRSTGTRSTRKGAPRSDHAERAAGKPTAPTQSLLRLFDACHVQKLGRKAYFDDGKDGALMAQIWRQRQGNTVEVETLIRAFFDHDDPWVREHGGHGVGTFKSQIPKLLSRLSRNGLAPAGAVPTADETRRQYLS